MTHARSSIRVIDSHTGGEPTRVVISGGPSLAPGPLSARLQEFRTCHDIFRSAVVNEPRGSDVMVGALLLEPTDPSCAAAVIFFNNVGCLGMCGHGAIGLLATLAHLGSITPGEHRIETPVGVITARLHVDGSVTVRNVPSFRTQSAVSLQIEGHGPVTGDVAWGGNWFFLVHNHGLELNLSNIDPLTSLCWKIRETLSAQKITGRDNQEIDHIELFGPPSSPAADSKNFVLCPGKAYDRSPCGTGTSAKLACLFADHKLQPGQTYRQESIIGSIFEGSIEVIDNVIYPSITGHAYINSEATLILDDRDPFRMGIRA